MEHGTNKEFTRIESKGISRSDVKKAYGYQGGDTLDFYVTFDTDWLKGKKNLFNDINKNSLSLRGNT